ncbi:MAG: histidinol dehydrogenase [Treponema sp.]|nr:histidinol dehydrogenase [Treponema sp.]
MIKILKASELEESFFEGRDFGDSIDVVKDVLRDVKNMGDKALSDYGAKFDVSAPAHFEIPQNELKAAAEKMKHENPGLYESLCYSRDLAKKFAERQRQSFDEFEIELAPGLFTGQKNIPVDRAGVYVPAGRFPLLSTVIMTVVPAKAAGVGQVIMCTPPRVHPDDLDDAKAQGTGIPGKPFVGGRPYADEGIMAAAFICGADKVYACGGSQAIGAMAFGTESIPKADVVVGPGNKFVAEAKRLIYGTVGIDMLAGPTEVFAIADDSANPKWLAADLLAQAEHDVVAQPILATDSEEIAKAVQQEIEEQLKDLPTAETARRSVDTFGKIIVTSSIEEACEIANKKAPEHLELAMDAGEKLEAAKKLVHNYGSLFIGHGSAEVFGDYAAGLNHTLPTSGSARFTGGLSVRAFIKTVTTLRTIEGKEGPLASAKAAGILGDAEGLAAHARAARIRIC